MHKNRTYVKAAAIFGALAVIFGAFGSHALSDMLQPAQLEAFKTAVAYQFYHVPALMSVGILYKRYHSRMLERAAEFFIAGMVLFSGSLYVSTLLHLSGRAGLGMFSFVTPLGGLLLVLGWICMFIGIPYQKLRSDSDFDH